jgi:hypothetical protein
MLACCFATLTPVWQVVMLEPRDRLLLFEALRPPEGFRFDQGIGTTYSLDLLALLTAPLAFTWFEQQGDEDQRTGIDSLEILESLRRHADQLTIFCHSGRIALPKVFYPQLAFIEDSIIQCQPEENGAFHPKVWVLRWVNDSGGVRYRVLCLSRNLTFARAWDTLLSLDGNLSVNRQGAISRNRGLVDFVRALPRFASRRPIETSISQRVETLASELERTEFELPDGMTNLRFWPMGIGGRPRDPLAESGDRLLVVSPFVTLGRLEELADGRKNVMVVSTSNALAHLARRPKGVSKFYSLIDRAMLEVDSEHEEKPESEAEAIQQSDLHAKLYVSESGWDAHIWTGSANATDAAFERNVEFLVELIGPRKRFGIDALMEPQKGEIRFVNLLEDAGRFVASEHENSAIEALEQMLEQLRGSISNACLEANVTPAPAGAFDVDLVCRATENVSIDPNVTLRCWPVTVRSSVGVSFNKLEQGKAAATFSGLSFEAITSFFAFELTGRASGEERHVCFVVNVTLVGAPEGRREHVLRSLVGDRSRMLRFLWLLLADEGVVVAEVEIMNKRESAGGERSSNLLSSGLFEMLLRNLDRAPERLDHLNSLLKELRQGADGDDLLPAGFDAIWEPIWRQRERLRSRSEV